MKKFRVVTKLPNNDVWYIQKGKFNSLIEAQNHINFHVHAGTLVEGEKVIIAEEEK